MANNIDVTPGAGKTVATEEVATFQYQKVKLVDSTAASAAGTGIAANPLQVSLANTAANAIAVKTDGSAVTQPISAASLPLPTGAATSANQTTGNSSLASIDTKLTAPLAISAASLPLPTGAATAANQTTGNTSLSSIDTKLTSPLTVTGTVAISTVTPGTGATNLGKAEDSAHTSGDVGVAALAIQVAAPGNLATDGDYANLQMKDGRLLTDISGVTLSVDQQKGANEVGKNEDFASASGDGGIPAMAIRQATPANTSGTDGDYEMLRINGGLLWTREGGSQVVVDDSAFTVATTPVVMAGFLADETSPDSVDEGDAGAARMTLDRKVLVTAQPTTSGGLLVANMTSGDGSSVLTNTAQAIKASAGQLYGWYIYNPNATAVYIPIYNTAAGSVTVGTTNPQMILVIPATSAANILGAVGIEFTNAGFSAAATTTGPGNTAPATGVEATFFYK